jgi:hypothetical protein
VGLVDGLRFGRLRRPGESLRQHANRFVRDRISGGAEEDILELLARIEALEARLNGLEQRG